MPFFNCPNDEIGSHTALKLLGPFGRTSSSLVSGTNTKFYNYETNIPSVNLCKLTDKLFAEFPNADIISIACNKHLTLVVSEKAHRLAMVSLYDEVFLTDTTPNIVYNAIKQNDKIKYIVGNECAVSGLELKKSMKKLRAIVHCCQKGGKVLLNIDDKLLETLKVLDSVF